MSEATAPIVGQMLVALGTATLGECGARRWLSPPAAMWPGAAVAGRARPVQCTGGDNLAIHVAVAHAEPGEVLVVDVEGVHEFGYWGEVLTVGAQARGIAGLVIDGCVRDVDALERRRFPAFARGAALPGATKNRPGRVGHRLQWEGIEIRTGDWVVADRDGVVVLPEGERDAIVDAARTRARNEDAMFAALEAGSTTVELLGLDESPVERG
jgi:4-hydroxy-4-methyl-2-oxoglutarate aldolase